jgi:outer membrane protein
MQGRFCHIILPLILLLTASDVFGQKFGYIDSKYILTKMPDYKKAEGELAKLSSQWQKEIETLRTEVEKMYKSYQAEEVLLTDEMKKERLDEIKKKEKETFDQQKKVFGFEGLLFLKRQELIKPVQDQLFEAVEKVCKKKGLQVMFDKSGEIVMIYTNPRHDYTDFVLEELGLGEKDSGEDKGEGNTAPAKKPTGR